VSTECFKLGGMSYRRDHPTSIVFMAGKARNSRHLVELLAVTVFALSLAGRLDAAEYYFSADGHDQNGDGSELQPWRTIGKCNSLDLEPGDHVYFRAGDVFSGSLFLDSDDSGTDSNGVLIAPIVLSSYGGNALDRAGIRSQPNREALLAYNNSGIELHNLEFFSGGSSSSNQASGIQFMLDENIGTGVSHFQHIRIDNVISRGFHRSGLSLYADDSAGFEDVEVTNSEFRDNQFAGIDISGGNWTDLVHRDVRIDAVTAHNNPGYAGCNPHCGHGIVLGQVDGAVIQNSVAHSNGLEAGKGNVGIWTWQSNDVTIERNTAYDNRSPNGGDGGGFDIDGGVTNSIVQYNVARNNSGAGFLLAQFGFAESMQHNVFRYNLSVNDGTDDYGAFTIWGQDSTSIAESTLFHNNTAVVDREVAPNSRGTVWFVNSNHDEINFVNNLFVALNGAAVVDGATTLDQAQFVNNAYWTGDEKIVVGGTAFTSIAEWATASQQEMLNGEVVGVELDSELAVDGEYRPVPPSALIDAGLDLDSPAWPLWFSGLGPSDLYGTPMPQWAQADVGAVEFVPLPGDYNKDNKVDASDYVVWRKSLDQVELGMVADGNRDGIIDGEDFDVWRANFGSTRPSGAGIAAAASTLSAIPEPPSFLLFIIALVGINPERRMRRLNPD
jgi:parallel beta helix pectate lyase-like protein